MPASVRWTRRAAVAAVAASLAATAACAGPAVETASTQVGPSTCISRVTPDCTEYSYRSPAPGTVVVTAAPSTAIDNREFFWDPNGPVATDLTVCATFVNGRGLDQQGVVLRLNLLPGDRVTGITVTRNVWEYAFDVFNFHVWDSAAHPSDPFTQFGSTVVPTLPERPAVYPLHLCARTVAVTDAVQFVVWTAGRSRPAWGTPGHSGQATIPSGAPGSGRGGWFAGHLTPGTSTTYADLRIDGTVAADLP